MWKQFPEDDIFILHADMTPHHAGWFEEVLEYVEQYPEAGMLGCLLFYPARNEEGEYYIQCAGGRFQDERPDHFGSGLLLENRKKFKDELEVDRGQYDKVREVAWTTFGGCYLRRSFIDTVGDFTRPTNGLTTETWITVFEDEKPVNVYIRSQSDSFTTNRGTLKNTRPQQG